MNPENIVERLRKVSMAKAKAMWPEADKSAKGARKGDYAQDMRDDLDDYNASLHEDDGDMAMPGADDPGWHHLGGAGDDGSDGDGGSDNDDGSDGDDGSGKGEKYVPRFQGGAGTTLSDEQRKKAADNIREAAEKQKANEESRDKAYAKSRERFESVSGTVTFNPDSAARHGMSDEEIEETISETPLEAVDFGYGENGESGGLLFQIVLPTISGVSGLRTIVGRIRVGDLYVFHAGATGGSQFTRLEY